MYGLQYHRGTPKQQVIHVVITTLSKLLHYPTGRSERIKNIVNSSLMEISPINIQLVSRQNQKGRNYHFGGFGAHLNSNKTAKEPHPRSTHERAIKRASLVEHPQRQNIKMPEVSLCAKNTTKTSQLRKSFEWRRRRATGEGVYTHESPYFTQAERG